MKLKQVIAQDLPHLVAVTGRKESQIKKDITFLLRYEGVSTKDIADMSAKHCYTTVKNKYIRFHTEKHIKYRPRTVKEIEMNKIVNEVQTNG